jgi:ribosomal protein S18 acetylase RimI-like enzyme
MTGPTLSSLDAAGLRAARDQVLDVYRAAYADMLDDPFRTPDRFWDRLDAYASREGFGMAAAHDGDTMVGFALGYPLPPNTRWWEGLRGDFEGDGEFVREDGRRTFAFNELIVRPGWDGQGLGRQLHDLLLRDRPEQRATILVRPDNDRARSAYLRWGWQQIGTMQPFPDSPVFDSLVRSLS